MNIMRSNSGHSYKNTKTLFMNMKLYSGHVLSKFIKGHQDPGYDMNLGRQ